MSTCTSHHPFLLKLICANSGKAYYITIKIIQEVKNDPPNISFDVIGYSCDGYPTYLLLIKEMIKIFLDYDFWDVNISIVDQFAKFSDSSFFFNPLHLAKNERYRKVRARNLLIFSRNHNIFSKIVLQQH
ncbi:hypothetical protein TRFO_34109 [Tritrichomonas foetus]|uniref:Uncharacterized protein n=1 Tax=Tritrichomonas foetus TaxID=1144522 RepID=A0A1J4JQB6_9EUKA|nr:hypothetical protein TRFO_34109 [Tritrichomonas foetus]|eukprot:OHS99428.1 hypothetical protein TRFO_34109 [Tritrichomonas foetus]